jgi:8-oxo-dGTP pyrophosphatase MutT (NUDIX family)
LAETAGPDRLRKALSQEAPDYQIAGPRASVASIFRSGHAGTELLFIQRAAKDGDPWSGHMAFPGGRVDPTDVDSFATAERETMEEVGLDLTPADRLGSLRELDGGRANNRLVAVNAHGYWLHGDPPFLDPNHEVAEALWVPLAQLADTDRHIDYLYPISGTTFPGIQLDKTQQVVWGLTLRFLSDLFTRLKTPFIIPD